MVNSAFLCITANLFCLETECFVYHLNVKLNLSNCEYWSELNKVMKHKLAGSKP